MKKLGLFMLLSFALVACKNEQKENDSLVIHDTVDISETETDKNEYPNEIARVFEAHGGISTWQHMNNLCFEMDGRGGTEIHTTDLKNRKAKIEHQDWSIGYNGSDVWLLQNKEDAYKGNARFYHNLMFYFYAMPFILADDGIVYSEVEPTELDGIVYKGIKVGYDTGVGDSPEDEYILYYDPQTYKMTWLAYTVTYKTNEPSDKWSYIKYDTWQEVNGLILPEKLTWFNVKDGKPTDERNDMLFNKVTVSKMKLDANVFAKPEAALVVPR